jgi:hypothetical protein
MSTKLTLSRINDYIPPSVYPLKQYRIPLALYESSKRCKVLATTSLTSLPSPKDPSTGSQPPVSKMREICNSIKLLVTDEEGRDVGEGVVKVEVRRGLRSVPFLSVPLS